MTDWPHVSVLPSEVLDLVVSRDEGWFLDGTLGAGGHAEAFLREYPRLRLLGLDKDPTAIAIAKKRLASFGDRARIRHADYRDFAEALPEEGIDELAGALLDLGVSSMHLDRPERGFTFRENGPLDMRFNPEEDGTTAADLLATATEEELVHIFSRYGEVRFSRKLARCICEDRGQSPFTETRHLADLVERIAPGALKRRGMVHPATQVFQALRIAVNNELDRLEETLVAVISRLSSGARFGVITFHSLEDRAVKQTFRTLSQAAWRHDEAVVLGLERERYPLVQLVNRKPLTASEEERAANSRSRSAKLRVVERV